MRVFVRDDRVEKRNRQDENREGLTLNGREDEREEGAEPPLNFHSFVRCV